MMFELPKRAYYTIHIKMINEKIKVCAFIHYSVTDTLPYYAEIYLTQLLNHFDKIKVLTNNTEINNQNNFIHDKIEFIHLENKGYDFGMFYRYFIYENLENISQIGLVNDSNILLNSVHDIFHWGNSNNFDFWGIIDSHEKPWFSNHENNYHIQSHFLIFNKKALDKLPEFFKTLDIDTIFNETNKKRLRRLVIENWEIGLTQFFISEDLNIGSYIDSNEFQKKYKPKKQNLTHSMYHELVSEGYPFMKKKIILEKKLFSVVKKEKWKETIENYGHHEWDISRILESIGLEKF